MKIDVSDLFDDLFAVAAMAYPRFRTLHHELIDYPESSWDTFCQQISDSLFLPACASRVYDLVAQRIEPQQLKRRIFSQRFFGPSSEEGLNMPYSRPRFFYSSNSPSAFEAEFTKGNYTGEMFCQRPNHALTVHLGRLPDRHFTITRPPFEPTSSKDTAYFWSSFSTIHGPEVGMYEMRENWCVREIRLGDKLYRIELTSPQWMDKEKLTPFDQEAFSRLWNAATDERL